MTDIFSTTARNLKDISYSLNFAFISVAFFLQTGGANWNFNLGDNGNFSTNSIGMTLLIFFIKSVYASVICYLIFMLATIFSKSKGIVYLILLANFFIGVGILGIFFDDKSFHGVLNIFWFIFSIVFGFSLQRHKEIIDPTSVFN